MDFSWKRWPARILTNLLDLAYPRDCLISNEPLSTNSYKLISESAVARLPAIKDPRCPTCGHPYSGLVERDATCFHCEELDPVYEEGRCAYLYMKDVKTLVHACKYRNRPYLAKDLAKLMRNAPGMDEFFHKRIVIPVPLHPRKLRERGFNQTEVILDEYKKIAPYPIRIEKILQRILDTDSQTTRNRKDRMKSVGNAFELVPNCQLNTNSHYVIFDDVFTTGSTLNTCANLLRKNGIPQSNIFVAAFAHG